jgi:predicted nucleic acid-binding protein
LVAILNRNDPNHAQCVATLNALPPGPLITTWPCFTEAMYLLHKLDGHSGQSALWRLWETGRLLLHPTSETEMRRMIRSMTKYHDLPMDLADASLLTAAEQLGQKSLFSLDGDFRVYRFGDGSTVQVFP